MGLGSDKVNILLQVTFWDGRPLHLFFFKVKKTKQKKTIFIPKVTGNTADNQLWQKFHFFFRKWLEVGSIAGCTLCSYIGISAQFLQTFGQQHKKWKNGKDWLKAWEVL